MKAAETHPKSTPKSKNSRIFSLAVIVLLAAILGLLAKPAIMLVRKTVLDRVDSPLTEIQGLTLLDDIRFSCKMGDIDCSGIFKRTESGEYLMQIEQPEEISGMRLSYSPKTGSGRVEYAGISAELDVSAFGSVADIAKVWEDMQDSSGITLRENGVLTELTGQLADVNYRMILDAKGRPQELTIPDTGAVYRFAWEE